MSKLTPEEAAQLEVDAKEHVTVLGTNPPPPPREPMSSLQKNALWVALVAVIAGPLWLAVAALGSKFGVWSFGFGLGKMTFQWSKYVLFAAVGICAIALILQLIKAPRRGSIFALIFLMVPILILGRMNGVGQVAAGLPPIHDVQTDWNSPLRFSDALLAEREANGWNPVLDSPVVPKSAAGRWPDAVGKTNKELQAESYAKFNLRPQLLEIRPEIAFEAAIEVAKKEGMEIVSADAKTGRIHATYTSFWYGFVDDVMIQVDPQGKVGSKVNVRSVSRVGLSDLGANATRINSFIEAMNFALSNR